MSEKALHEQIEDLRQDLIKANSEIERLSLKTGAHFSALYEVMGFTEAQCKEVDLLSVQKYEQLLQRLGNFSCPLINERIS